MHVVAAHAGAARIFGGLGLREDPVPGPGHRRARVLARQRKGGIHARQTRRTVGLPQGLGVQQLLAQRQFQRGRQHHHAVLGALAFAHDDGAVEVDVLGAQAQRFQQAHAGAVQHTRHQPQRSGMLRLQALLFTLLHIDLGQQTPTSSTDNTTGKRCC